MVSMQLKQPARPFLFFSSELYQSLSETIPYTSQTSQLSVFLALRANLIDGKPLIIRSRRVFVSWEIMVSKFCNSVSRPASAMTNRHN